MRFRFDLMHPLVRIDHELMEMDPFLPLDILRQGLVEEVHQHAIWHEQVV